MPTQGVGKPCKAFCRTCATCSSRSSAYYNSLTPRRAPSASRGHSASSRSSAYYDIVLNTPSPPLPGDTLPVNVDSGNSHRPQKNISQYKRISKAPNRPVVTMQLWLSNEVWSKALTMSFSAIIRTEGPKHTTYCKNDKGSKVAPFHSP